jgi:hypothetical protein
MRRRKAGDDDSWYTDDPEAIQGYGTITQLTDHASRRVDKKEPIGFKVTKKRDKNMQHTDAEWAAIVAAEPWPGAAIGAARPKGASPFEDIAAELERAKAWPPFNSAHEGFAIMHEEFDELKAHVWTKQKLRNLAAMRVEAIQVAAMAIKFVEMIDAGWGRV